MSDEKPEIYFRGDKAILTFTCSRDLALCIDKLAKECGLTKTEVIVTLLSYGLKKIVEEEEAGKR